MGQAFRSDRLHHEGDAGGGLIVLAKTKSFLKALFRRSRLEQDMRTEMASHMETYIEDLISRGVPAEEAQRRARVEFGAVEEVREECRESVGLRLPFEIARDLRYAGRILRKSPAFTITAVITLALCIGVNTAIFSVVDSVLLRPLPYPEPDRLAAVATYFKNPDRIGKEFSVTGRTLEHLHDASSLDVAAYAGIGLGANLVIGAHAEYVRAQRVSAGYFRVLGVKPAVGRELTVDEDRPGGPAVAVLSHALWKRLFNEDPNAVGRAIKLKGEPYTVVGVMPASFRPPDTVDLWTPMRPSRTGEGGGMNYDVIARLRPGASWAQADSQLRVVAAAAVKEMQLSPVTKVEMRAVPLQREFTDSVRTPLLVLWGAVVVVLIIGCVNIAGLLLVRGAARTREIGTRMALGSGRSAVIRQLLSETVLLAVIGGTFGILLGQLGLKALKLLSGTKIDLTDVALDGRVLLISACASILTGLIFGVVPALQASRVDIRSSLTESGTRGIAGGGHRWTRRGLVIAEVSLGVVLLVVAGLLIRTFLYLHNLDPGFDGTNVITTSASLQDARYKTAQSVNRLFDQSLERIRELPGVQFAGVGLSLPYERPLNMGFMRLDGPHVDKDGQITNLTYVTPGYFEGLRIRLLSGRLFTDADKADSQPVAIVNERFVRSYLRDQNPVGSHIGSGGVAREIVGVVRDTQQTSGFGSGGPLSPAQGVFIPAAQTEDKFLQLVHTWFAPQWVVRTTGSRQAMIASIQKVVQSADPQLPLASFRGMDDVVSRSMADERFQAVLLGGLAALAMLLAAVGIYGLIANTVVERTRELGIRMALGATVWQGMRSIALPGMALALVGVIIGCALARGCVSAVEHLIYGVRSTDPLTFIVAAGALLLATTVASVIPALRVTRLNPADTLRSE
jgi:predicted permease